MKSVDRMSLSELTDLNKRVESAIVKARHREASELRQQISELAARSGFKLAELFEAKSAKVKAVTRKPSMKYKDRETGVIWQGRGKYPRQFDRSRAEMVAP